MVKYPLRTLIRFNQLAVKREAHERLRNMNAVRAAMHADLKAYKKLVDEIRDG